MASFFGSLMSSVGSAAPWVADQVLQAQERKRKLPYEQSQLQGQQLQNKSSELGISKQQFDMNEEARKNQAAMADEEDFKTTSANYIKKIMGGTLSDEKGQLDISKLQSDPDFIKLQQWNKGKSMAAPAVEQGQYSQEKAYKTTAATTDYGYDIGKIKEQGQQQRLTEQIRQAGDTENRIGQSSFTKDESEHAYKFLKRVDEDRTLQTADKAIMSGDAILNLVNSVGPGQKLAASVIEVQMPRLMGEVGNLAVQEQIKWKGSQDVVSQFKRMAKKAANGEMIDSDKEAISSTIKNLMSEFGRKGTDRINLLKQQSQGISGLDDEKFNPIVEPYTKRYQKYIAPESDETQNVGSVNNSTPVVSPKTQKEYDAIPSGTIYIDTDGLRKRKK
jgi:hypothetical protein